MPAGAGDSCIALMGKFAPAVVSTGAFSVPQTNRATLWNDARRKNISADTKTMRPRIRKSSSALLSYSMAISMRTRG